MKSVASLPAAPPKLSDAVYNWVHRSQAFAEVCVRSGTRCGRRERELQRAFMFFYARKLLEIYHRVTGIAYYAQADHTTVMRWLRLRPAKLDTPTERAMSSWAALLAQEGATHREVRTVFSLAIYQAALKLSKGPAWDSGKIAAPRHAAWGSTVTRSISPDCENNWKRFLL